MKVYMDPTMEVLKISVEDIITTSNGGGAGTGGDAGTGGMGDNEW